MGSVSRHGRLVYHVINGRALQDTLTFVGIQSACAGVMVVQWMLMNKPVKMVCKSNVFVGHSGVALLPSDMGTLNIYLWEVCVYIIYIGTLTFQELSCEFGS